MVMESLRETKKDAKSRNFFTEEERKEDILKKSTEEDLGYREAMHHADKLLE